jgi:hypothetical protein
MDRITMGPKLARFILAIGLLWPTFAQAGFPNRSYSFAYGGAAAPVIFNAITDLGLTCNGVTDDQPALDAATATNGLIRTNPRVIQGAPVTIVFPPGVSCQFQSCSHGDGMFTGLPNRTYVATGAFIGFTSNACNNWGEAAFYGDVNDNQNPFKMNQHVTAVGGGNVPAGSTCVQMSIAGTETNYFVGQWTILSGWALQTQSFPPNYGFFDYLQIASINTSTHVICFTKPNSWLLKLSWPDWGIVNESLNIACGGPPCGGPPWLLGTTYKGSPPNNGCQRYVNDNPANGSRCIFDQTITFIGGQYFSGAQVNGWAGARNVRVENVTWTSGGGNCPFPSATMNISYINSNWEFCNIEADKEVQNWTISGGHMHSIQLQSSSVYNIDFINGAVIDSTGSPGVRLNCVNSTINSIRFGNTFGQMNQVFSFNGNGCIFNQTPQAAGNFNAIILQTPGLGNVPFVYGGSGVMTCTGSIPNVSDCNSGPAQQIAPFTYWFCCGNARQAGWPLVINDGSTAFNTPGGNAQTIDTTLTDGNFALITPQVDRASGYVADPVRNWNCVNCVGATSISAITNIADLSQAPSQGKPLYTYSKKTYTCAANVPNVPGSITPNDNTNGTGQLGLVGIYVSQTWNVITPDTSTLPSILLLVGAQEQMTNQATGANIFPNNGVINLKIAGQRQVTQSTSTGWQSGDTPIGTPNGFPNYYFDTGALGGVNAGGISPGTLPNTYQNTTPASACAVWTQEDITMRP